MSKKIFYSMLAVTMSALAASFIFATVFLHNYFNGLQVTRLKDELAQIAASVDRLGISFFDGFDSSVFRFTLISADGSVIYDSQLPPTDLGNHLEREEISQAFKTGRGSSARYSSSLTERTFYEAARLRNGDVLRIAISQVTVGALLIEMFPAVCIIVLISAAVAFVLSRKMAKNIVKPLNELDLENPIENDVYDELAPVLIKIDRQHDQISQQMHELRQKSDEFEQITASMTEGLILLDKKGVILSINNAAKKLFCTDSTAVGHDFLLLDRSASMSRAVKKALDGKCAEFREQRGQNEYQFIINRTESDGSITGVVILCLDVTEAAFAERNRREFTANVSHELKTPLQSIIGSAELLENGLVKSEDIEKFAGNIKREASRLLLLINDIIRLSQLDENIESTAEPVDLYILSKEVVDALSVSAQKKNININLSGGTCIMRGNRSYLYEIIYNLCDNAIRYSNDQGTVSISVKNDCGDIILSVADNGIGIPEEHRSRIFERFYRVDKSHSKETGGTGLGLSIVKHAAAYHGGTISLSSKVGQGTEITVKFPQQSPD